MGCTTSKQMSQDEYPPIPGSSIPGHGSPVSPALEGSKLDPITIDLYERTVDLVKEKRTRELITELKNDEARNIIEFLHNILESRYLQERSEIKWVIHTLSGLCRSALLMPEELGLESSDVQNLQDKINCKKPGVNMHEIVLQKRKACVKAIRVQTNEPLGSRTKNTKAIQALVSEAVLAAHLSHPNVLPLYGTYLTGGEENPEVWTVWPKLDNDHLASYLQKHPKKPRFPLMMDTLSGLQYLHQNEIVHGDLRAANILISSEGTAVLQNFNVSRASLDAPTLTQVGDEEWYWMAPEVLDGSRPKDLENDIWAFACTYYKVLTGNPPFADVYPTETALINGFSRVGSQKKDSDFQMIPKLGQKLSKSESKLNDGWDSEQLKKCWTWDHTKRITADALFKSFNKGDSKAHRTKHPAKPSPISRQKAKSDVNLDHVDAILKRLHAAGNLGE